MMWRLRRACADVTCTIFGHDWLWMRRIWTMWCERCGKSWHPVDPPTAGDVVMFRDGA